MHAQICVQSQEGSKHVSELLLSTERNSTFNLSYSNMEQHTCDTAA